MLSNDSLSDNDTIYNNSKDESGENKAVQASGDSVRSSEIPLSSDLVENISQTDQILTSYSVETDLQPNVQLHNTLESASGERDYDVNALNEDDPDRGQSFIELHFPETAHVPVVDVSGSDQAFSQSAGGDRSVISVDESRTASKVTSLGEKEDINIMQWNMSGYRISRTHFDKILDNYQIHVAAISESWWRWELARFDFEVNNPARDPYQHNFDNEYMHGRPSGGTALLSQLAAHREKVLRGMVKAVIQGIVFVNIYINDDNKDDIYKQWDYIRDLVNSNKRICVVGDFNCHKASNVRNLTQLGMTQVNTNPTQFAERHDRTESSHFNDQIFVYRLEAEMVKEIKRRDAAADVFHESPHNILVFKIKKRLPRLRIPMLMLPDTDDAKKKFTEALKKELADSVGDKLDVLQNSINKISKDLRLVRTVRGYRKLKFHWSDDDYNHQKSLLAEAYSWRHVDHDRYKAALKHARQHWMAVKRKQWTNQVNKCVKEKRHFGLVNLLSRKGKIWNDYQPATTSRQKRPTITDNIDRTEAIWRDQMVSQQRLKPMPATEHLNGLAAPAVEPVVHNISAALLKKILTSKNGKSSPGPSGVRYLHLSMILEACPEFLVELINEQLNSSWAPDRFNVCTVIPVYKVNKMLEIDDPKAFRMIVLQDVVWKLVGSAWQALRHEYIVENMGDLNHAYRPKRGVHTALTKVSEHINDLTASHGGGILFCYDVRRAFSSVARSRMFQDFKLKFPRDPFMEKLSNVQDSLTLSVDLGFTKVQGIECKTGLPEGDACGAILYAILKSSVTDFVLRMVNDARLVLFSDDIANIVESVEKLTTIYQHLSIALEWFGMTLDDTKAQFIRFGNCSVESIVLRDRSNNVHTIRFSPSIRYLGFQIKDILGIDLKHHIESRCNKKAKEYELIILKWVSKNQYFDNRIKRQFVLTRVIPKLFFMVKAVMDCSDLREFDEFKVTDEFINGDGALVTKSYVRSEWVFWDKMDVHNHELTCLAKQLTAGMSNPQLAAALFYIKPLHCAGMPVKMQDIRRFWLRLAVDTGPYVRNYFWVNQHIMDGINFRKHRLPNTHLLTCLLTGHYTKFCQVRWQAQRSGAKSNKCPQCRGVYNEHCQTRLGNCICNLAIPGIVPKNRPFLKEHFDFIRFLNRLAAHDMFEIFHKDPPQPINDDDIDSNAFEYDGVTDCVTMQTDGSFKDGRAGWGFAIDLKPGMLGNSGMYGPVFGRQRSNNRAELTAILEAIKWAQGKQFGDVRLCTDSQQCIQALTLFRRCHEPDLLDEDVKSPDVTNLDLIKRISDLIRAYTGKVFITKVLAHSGIAGNEAADSLAEMGRNMGF